MAQAPRQKPHLRQKGCTPAPHMGRALRHAQGPVGGRFRAGGSTGSPSGPTGPSTSSGTGRREIPGRWFDRLTIQPDRPFDSRLRDRPAGDSGPVVRQAHHPARPALRQAQGPAGGRVRAGGSTSSPSGPTGPSAGPGTGRWEIPGRWFDRLTIRPDRSLRQAQRPVSLSSASPTGLRQTPSRSTS